MRLLMTGDTAGGVLTLVTQLASGLNAKGWNVTVATFGHEPAELPKNIRWLHHTSKLEWQPDPWAELESAGEWLRFLVNREHPELHIARKEPLVLSAGRFWDEAKNIQTLDAIAPSLDWTIYLAGEADAKSNCRLLGQLKPDELAGWYARASIYVSAAKYEPFGLAIPEAAMSGCALLLSDIPSLREMWSGCALFFQPGQLYAALNRLIHSPDLRVQLQKQAWQRSRQFTQSAMVSRSIAAYEHSRSYACAS